MQTYRVKTHFMDGLDWRYRMVKLLWYLSGNLQESSLKMRGSFLTIRLRGVFYTRTADWLHDDLKSPI